MIFGFLKKKPKKTAVKPKPEGEMIGEITHYFGHCKAGVIKLKSTLALGDTIHIQGHTTDFKQKVQSLQIDGKDVEKAGKADEAGFVAKKRVRSGDSVYKI